MAISIIGTYTSQDGQFKLNIAESVSSQGTFSGTFTIKGNDDDLSMPQVTVYNVELGNGSLWNYTKNQNIAGLGFMVLYRPEDRSYVLFDSWAGSITNKNELIMNGSRSYTLPNGTRKLYSFENIKFIYSN